MSSLLGPVVGLPWNNPPNSAPGIFLVAFVSRNQMDVQMRDRLACGRAVVDTDVKAGRHMLVIQFFLRPIQKQKESLPLLMVSFEE